MTVVDVAHQSSSLRSASWSTLPGRACFRESHFPNVGNTVKQVLSLSYGRIIVKAEDKLRGLVPESFETYQIIEPGDIIVRPTDLQNDQTSLRFGIARDPGIITSAYLCLRTKEPLDREYGYLLLHAYDVQKVFYGLGSGLRQNLDWGDFKYLECLVPPMHEQRAIVKYLDHADRRIRKYIAAKQRLIKLLEEQRQAVIHQAVTRGPDPTVPLKPSGIPWLGEIPANWSVMRARFLFREVDMRSSDGSEQHLSMSQVKGLVPSEEIERRTLISESYAGGKLCSVGDLVLNRLKAHLGVFATAQVPGVVSGDYTVFRALDPEGAEYYEHVLRSPGLRHELRVRAKGIVEGFWRLYTDDFNDIWLPVPPAEERTAILRNLQGIKESCRHTTLVISRDIDLLREYRTRLFADVVTGKLDVREAAANLLEDLEETSVADDDGSDEDVVEQDELEHEEVEVYP